MKRRRPTIRNSLRTLRSAADGMTQQALADRVGCTRQTILLLEQERYTPSLLLAMRIARTFGKTVDEVFALDDPEPR